MNITVIKEGEILRIIKSSEPIPDGTKLKLYTAAEINALAKRPTTWETAQLESAFQEGEEDWGTSLDSITEESK
ncbi:MAG: hypothetical protein ACOYM3_17035 [Terrimicrobiaceae bacterium]